MHDLIRTIRESVIGDNVAIDGPFGEKPLIYADYTASGRSLTMVEDFIRQDVLPFYANTHSETSFTGAQTTALREQAREQIRQSVNGSERDQIIFCGSGATTAIHKLIDILNLRLPADLNDRYNFERLIPDSERPVVFIGPYEHHSNELPWRESIARLIPIPLATCGQLDTDYLEQQLKKFQNSPLLIGSFSAASNVTGIKTNVDLVSRLLHQHGALSFWDYAAAAPYIGIDMSGNGSTRHDNSKDAVFVSPHKFVGGPGTPGVLIVKKSILNNRIPSVPGGGTVAYVTPEDHRYIEDHQRREEGGTPAIVESIRAGLVFKIQQDVGTDNIEAIESDFVTRAFTRWSNNENIEILGNLEAPRLSIASLRVKHQAKDLHYGFVVALLNDLFGIQARGGCSCAGPYGHSLFGMDMAYSKAIEQQISAGHMIMRPGWVRLNFNYFIDEDTFEYLIRAIELVAEHGWRLLPYYRFDEVDGLWRFQNQEMKVATHLASFTLDYQASSPTILTHTLEYYLEHAQKELTKESRQLSSYTVELPSEADQFRWFVLPQEIASS